MTINYEMIGCQIQRKRRMQRMTQEQLAERIEMSASYINRIEHAKKRASLEAVGRIAKVLGTTVDYFLLGNQEYDGVTLSSVWLDVLEDCSDMEQAIILETVFTLKASLHRYQSDAEKSERSLLTGDRSIIV